MKNIQRIFQKITGFELKKRQTNYLSEKIMRKDQLFEKLSRLYFEEPEKFYQLSKKILPLIEKKSNPDETLSALAGYICYIKEDFKRAKKYFLKCIYLNPRNLDNWLDLAFALRHLGKNKLANGILFNFDYIIYYYQFLKLKNPSFSELKDLILMIVEKSLNNLS